MKGSLRHGSPERALVDPDVLREQLQWTHVSIMPASCVQCWFAVVQRRIPGEELSCGNSWDALVLVGGLPIRAIKLVGEWTSLHREELEADWDRAKGGGTPKPIDPLP